VDVKDVPQEGNCTLGQHRKALYARDRDGRMVMVPSRGSEVDETVTMQAVKRMDMFAQAAKARALAGSSSPLEYWMWTKRMDVALLSQVTGIWQWRIRRHFPSQAFAKLSPQFLARYAQALGISVAQLTELP
jgi:hypothetical protein